MKIILICYSALFEGTTRVGHLYSALVHMFSLNSMFNFTLKLVYVQLKQQVIERMAQKKSK